MKKTIEAAVVAAAGIVLRPEFGGGFGAGVGEDLLAVFHHETDFGAVAESVGPEPEVVGGRRQGKGLGGIQNIGMQTMGREKYAVTTAESVFEGRTGICGIPFPATKGRRGALGIEDNGFDAACVDE